MNLNAQPTSTFKLSSAATTNANVVKGGAGRLTGFVASNVNAAARYVKLYDKASAPTVGTDIPVLTVPVPASGVVSLSLGALGIPLANGLALAITGAAADADTTAIAAGDVKVLASYQ